MIRPLISDDCWAISEKKMTKQSVGTVPLSMAERDSF